MVKLINYSYANIDIDNYLNDFKKNRSKEFQLIFNRTFENINEYDKVVLKINSNIINEEKINFINRFEVDTISFLYDKCNYLMYNNKLDVNSEKWMDSFQKKFEVYNKLFSKYNKKTMTKASNKTASIKVYILLSIILHIKHIKNVDWNAFNTGSKLIDFILYNKNLLKKSERSLMQNAINLEYYCIDDCLSRP
ncbi:hypothetical protein HN836_01435 [Candidatus Woesearchaeota archaeon]|jgi:hypothetical protein|nr:hypothetical protein [Candidatus Woesearchaeota archaeon]